MTKRNSLGLISFDLSWSI